eukprot:1110011-Pyramimonas_sp.AAC.4
MPSCHNMQVGTGEEDLQAAVMEHSDWLQSNCEAQKQTATDKEEKGSTALAATEGFSQEAAATLLEEEV